MQSFNFWFVFAPLGAVVAVYFGYLVHGKCYADFLRKYLAVPMGTIFGLLLVLESHRGGTQLMLNTIAKDDFEVAVGFMIAGFAVVAWRYGKLIQKLVLWGEELNYPASVRKARRERQDYTITKVVSTQAIKQALRQADTQEYEDTLNRMADLAAGIEWIDLDNEPDVEVIPKSDITVEPTPRVIPHPAFGRPAAVSTLQALTSQLSLEDAKLVVMVFMQEPALRYMLVNPNLFAKIEIINDELGRRLQISGAVYPRKKVV